MGSDCLSSHRWDPAPATHRFEETRRTIVDIDHLVIDCVHVETFVLGRLKVLHIDFYIDEPLH